MHFQFPLSKMAAYPSFLNMNRAGVLVPSPWIGLIFVVLPLQATTMMTFEQTVVTTLFTQK